nr:immunoglobulin domain-containing protein [Lachnospiraceae bacterium]
MRKKAIFKKATAFLLAASMCLSYLPAKNVKAGRVKVDFGYTTEYISSVTKDSSIWSNGRINYIDGVSVGDTLNYDVSFNIPEGYTVNYQWFVKGDVKLGKDLKDTDITTEEADDIIGENGFLKESSSYRVLEELDNENTSGFSHVLSEDDFVCKDVDGEYANSNYTTFYLRLALTKDNTTKYEYYKLNVEEEMPEAVYDPSESEGTIYVTSGSSVTITGPTYTNENYEYVYEWSKDTNTESTDRDTVDGKYYTVDKVNGDDEGEYSLKVTIKRKNADYSSVVVDYSTYYYYLELKDEESLIEDNTKYVDVSVAKSPSSDEVEASINEKVEFSPNVTLTGDDNKSEISYQWYFGDSKIEGATEATYSTVPTCAASFGTYKCVSEIKLDTESDTKYYFSDTNKTTKTITTSWNLSRVSSIMINNYPEDEYPVKYGDTFKYDIDATSSKGELTYKWKNVYYPFDDSVVTTHSSIEFELNHSYEYIVCNISNGVDTESVGFYVYTKDEDVDNYYDIESITGDEFNKAVGDDVKFGLRFTSYKEGVECTYQWYKIVNGAPRVIEGATSDTYSINDITNSDFGNYYCNYIITYDGKVIYDGNYYYDLNKTERSEYPDNVNFTYSVDGSPVDDIYYYPGSDFKFNVSASAKTDISYKWIYYSDNCSVDEDGNEIGEVLSETGSSLAIEDFDNNKEGKYEVVVTYETSDGTKTDRHTFEAEVRYPEEVSFSYPASSYYAEIGDTVTLTINATCQGAEELEYKWYKDSSDGHYYSVELIEGANTNTLTIENVTKDDFASYYVSVNNGYEDYYSEDISLKESNTTEEIALMGAGIQNNYVFEGEDATLELDIDESIAEYADFTWYDAADKVIQSGNSNKLTINNVQKEDYNEYTCCIRYKDKEYNYYGRILPKADISFTDIGEDAEEGYNVIDVNNNDYVNNMVEYMDNINYSSSSGKPNNYSKGNIHYITSGSYLVGNVVYETVSGIENEQKTFKVNAESELGKNISYKWYRVVDGNRTIIDGVNKASFTTALSDEDVYENATYVCCAYTDTSFGMYLYHIEEKRSTFGIGGIVSDKVMHFITSDDEEVTLNVTVEDDFDFNNVVQAAWGYLNIEDNTGFSIKKYGKNTTYSFIPSDKDFVEISDGVKVAVYAYMVYGRSGMTVAPFIVVKVDPEKNKSEDLPSLHIRDDVIDILSGLDTSGSIDAEKILGKVANKLVQTYTEPGAEKIELCFDDTYSLGIKNFDLADLNLTVIDAAGNKTVYDSANDIAGKKLEFEGDTVTFCYGINTYDADKILDLISEIGDADSAGEIIPLLLPYASVLTANYGYKAYKEVIPEEDETYAELIERLAELEEKVAEMEEAQTPTGSSVEPSEEPSVEPSEEPSVEPSVEPSEKPSMEPSDEPPVKPSDEPSIVPSEEASVEPSVEPSEEPSSVPTESAAVPTGSALTPTESAVVPSESPSASPAAES